MIFTVGLTNQIVPIITRPELHIDSIYLIISRVKHIFFSFPAKLVYYPQV